MASIRNLKKYVIYQTNELLDDCRLSIWFNQKANQEAILEIMLKCVDLRNDLFEAINNPAEKHNPKLLKKHYQQVVAKLHTETDELFGQLSAQLK